MNEEELDEFETSESSLESEEDEKITNTDERSNSINI